MDEPDLRFFTWGDYGPTARGLRIEPSIGQIPTRYWRDMLEYNWFNKIDFSKSYTQWGSLKAKLQFGGAFSLKERDFNEYQYRYDQNGTDFSNGGEWMEGQPNLYVSEDNAWTWDDRFSIQNPSAVWIKDGYDPTNNYDTKQTIAAAYLMTDLPITERLRAILGIRAEKTNTIFTSAASTHLDPRTGRLDPNYEQFWSLNNSTLLDELDVLPSLNMTYELKENMNLRMAYGRTLARPTFRELAPYQSFQFVGDYNVKGNTDLKMTDIDNFDLRWEYFPRPGELFSFSVFGKLFTNPIERTFNPITANPLLEIRNVDNATLYGIEVEARKSLDGIGGIFEFTSVGANMSIVKSEVDIAPDELQDIRALAPSTP